eukprot:8416554-Karenia_brevis.AAC.1
MPKYFVASGNLNTKEKLQRKADTFVETKSSSRLLSSLSYNMVRMDRNALEIAAKSTTALTWIIQG